jgi:hypothetical protein
MRTAMTGFNVQAQKALSFNVGMVACVMQSITGVSEAFRTL